MTTIQKPKVLEKHVQAQIKSYLEMTGWFVAVTSTPAMTAATKGMADLVATKKCKAIYKPDDIVTCTGCLMNRTVWIECKGPKGKQSEAQAAFQFNIEAQGGEYLLARSVEDVQEYLK